MAISLGSLIAKGTGVPDYVKEIRLQGTARVTGTIRQVTYVPRLGTVGNSGTITRVTYNARLGTAVYVNRLGTIGHTGTVPTVSYVPVLGTLSSRYSTGVTEWLNYHQARGSNYAGSWRDVSRFFTKTVAVRATQAGTLHIISAIVGTATDQGTYFSGHIGGGSYTIRSWQENTRFAKLRWQASGSSNTGKGTLTVSWGNQA